MSDDVPRTKGQAIAAGKTHLLLQCGCKSSYWPWEHLPNYADDVPLHVFTYRMKCKDRCGERPKVIKAASLDELTPKLSELYGPSAG